MYTQGPSGHPYWLKTNCSQPHAAVRFRHAAIWEACELSSKGALSSKNCELSCSENESTFPTGHTFPTSPAGLFGWQCGALGAQRGGGGGGWHGTAPCSVIVAGVTLAKLPTAEDIRPDA